jgi:hypothetical protein
MPTIILTELVRFDKYATLLDENRCLLNTTLSNGIGSSTLSSVPTPRIGQNATDRSDPTLRTIRINLSRMQRDQTTLGIRG